MMTRNIVENQFERLIPEWKKLSATDPMKILSESISLSLEELSSTYDRQLEKMLNRTPALFGFEPKPALPELELLQLSPTSKMKEPFTLGKGFTLSQNDSNSFQKRRTQRDIEIFPVKSFEVLTQNNQLTFKFSSTVRLNRISFLFVPSTATSEPSLLNQISTDLGFEDNTKQFSQLGRIQLYCRHNLESLSEEITLTFANHIPQGEFFLNTFPFEVFDELENKSLGSFAFQPWTEVPLPLALLDIPEEVQLRLADGSLFTVAEFLKCLAQSPVVRQL
jgi:hypothetical protein